MRSLRERPPTAGLCEPRPHMSGAAMVDPASLADIVVDTP
jgi:hypothetical protein